MKAEGGFAAVFTEVCMVSQDSDAMPFVASKLIDKGDIRNLRLMTDEVHKYGGGIRCNTMQLVREAGPKIFDE